MLTLAKRLKASVEFVMPNNSVPQLIQMLLQAYTVISVINALLSFVLWRRMKIALFKQLGLLWLAIIAAGIVHGVFQGSELAIGLSWGSAIPPYFLNIWLVSEVAKKTFHWRRMAVLAVLANLAMIPLHALGASFMVMTMPMALVYAFCFFYYSIPVLSDPQATFVVKVLALMNFLNGFHLLDFPFLRLNMAFAPYGFTLAILHWITFSFLIPISIIDAIGRASLRTRDEFISMASHELKTPLASLKLGIEGLKRNGEDRAFFAEVSEKQLSHMGRLINNLLSVSSIRMRGFKISPEQVCLNDLLDEVVERLRGFPNPDQQILVTYRCTQKIVGNWDRQKLEQILVNLLNNAIKYGKGLPVEVEVSEADGWVQVVVQDRGIGISEEFQNQIFEPYKRAVNVANIGGLGLGLYIVRKFIEGHGGAIALKSEVGVGSSFTVTLPLVATKESAG